MNNLSIDNAIKIIDNWEIVNLSKESLDNVEAILNFMRLKKLHDKLK
jgi:hypothetical protein